VAPVAGETYNIVNTLNTYLNSGVIPEKLFLGVPWYGLDWPVTNEARKATATGKASSRTYSASQLIAADNVKIFDQSTRVPWVRYTGTFGWRQMWFEDNRSLAIKYDLVNSMNLGGTGIWAISYEGTFNEVWETLYNVYSGEKPERDEIIRIWPNPVNGIARVRFTLAARGRIVLKIADIAGRVRLVLTDEEREAGTYTEEFDTGKLGQGIYFCILTTGKKTSSDKIILLRN
jgi:GH18 family chitinase